MTVSISFARQLNAAHFMRETLGARSELRVTTLEKMGAVDGTKASRCIPLAHEEINRAPSPLASISAECCEIQNADASVLDFDQLRAC